MLSISNMRFFLLPQILIKSTLTKTVLNLNDDSIQHLIQC